MIKKILVVEDEPATAKLLERRLATEGYEVFVAHDSRTAEDRVRQLLPDLVLMDIILPEMDGAEIVQLMKKNPQTKNIPVIFISGVVGEQDSHQSEVIVGEVSYPAIAKPINFDQLFAQINRTVTN